MNRSIRTLLLFHLALTLAVTTGCWGQGHTEIENKSVFVGLALDTGSPSQFEQQIEAQGDHYPKIDIVTATVQIVPPGIRGSQGEQGSSPSDSQDSQYLNQQLTGDSFLQIFRQYSLRNERPLLGLHLKAIIVSSELARRYSMEQIFDFMFRDNDIRPSCLIMVSHGRAADALESNRPGEIPSFRLTEINHNRFRTNKILPPVSLSKLENLTKGNTSFLLQNVVAVDGEQDLSGAAIFKGDTKKWIGELTQADLEGLSWITENIKGGVVKTYAGEDGHTITYEIERSTLKVTPTITGEDDIAFHIKVQSEGRLIEDWSFPEATPTQAYLSEMEEEFEQQISKQIDQVLHKLQHVYRVDVGQFGEYIRIRYPKVWSRIKAKWDETFSRIPITYDIQMTITDYGSSKE